MSCQRPARWPPVRPCDARGQVCAYGRDVSATYTAILRIATLDVHKGPYAARYGDFYTAGAIELRTIDELPRPTIWLTGGSEVAGPVAGKRLSSRSSA